ncbi:MULTISPECIES: tetratricopeptide repeat protein [Providencia]|uniref:Sel1 repeat family protein n=3 Tax=Providencia heimbachae TaxID=333962 RepID=A0A1B7K3I2_9GAMM|nr:MULTISPECIES: tetratricopeptide repeat protein [Providencia]MBP6124257.1 sel1 repeat family protein [Providencia sp.]NIH22721.1 sel1 repeat family protein [Providencia heimbachae]OAT54712.1 hypothetical protein M998_0256 [Providencia heimbachae ATCC 35613]SQH13314.1 Putative beta-lactamase hcpC precursor [Providencia heimbachae]
MKGFVLFLFILFSPFPFFASQNSVKQSDIEQWTELATNKNSAQAQYALGISYFYGDGVEKNNTKAIEWLEKSAKQGDVDAQSFLGAIYYWGTSSIPIDYTKALLWNEKAANNNHVNGQFYLGLMYGKGLAVKQNHEKALYWLTKATENEYNSDAAKYYLGLMYANGYGVPKDYVKARALFKSMYSDIQGLYVLALMNIEGIGGEQNYEEARRLLEQVAVSEEREIIVPKSLIYLILLMETKKIQPKLFSNSVIYAYVLLNYALKPYPSIQERVNNIIIGD